MNSEKFVEIAWLGDTAIMYRREMERLKDLVRCIQCNKQLGLCYDGSCKLGHHLCFDCWEKAGHKCPICDQTQKDRIMTQKESINQAMETGNDCTITLAEIRAELWQAFDHFEHHDLKKARECLVRAEKEVSVLNLNFKEMRRCIDSSDESIGASIAANGSAPQFPAC